MRWDGQTGILERSASNNARVVADARLEGHVVCRLKKKKEVSSGAQGPVASGRERQESFVHHQRSELTGRERSATERSGPCVDEARCSRKSRCSTDGGNERHFGYADWHPPGWTDGRACCGPEGIRRLDFSPHHPSVGLLHFCPGLYPISPCQRTVSRGDEKVYCLETYPRQTSRWSAAR